MRTDPSFSAKSEGLESDNKTDHQEELNLPEESDPAADSSEEPQHLADYRRRYGLSTDPFADDQHFPLYTGGQRRQILDQLLHVCQFSNNLLVVLGGYSVGKTRMAQALIDSLDDADDICFLEAQVTSSFDSLVAGVVTQFELPDVETLTEFVKRHSDSDGLAVLIVDNAHHLTDDVLLQLIDLIRPHQDTRVHLVLFAESHLLPRLQGLDVEDVVVSDFQLIKFSLAEAVDYLNFRMEMADYLGPEIFTEANVETWWRQSRGQLLELHQYAQDKLLASASSPRSVSYDKKALPIPHIVGAAALGAALIMGLVYWSGESSTTEPPKLTAIPAPRIAEQPVASTQSASVVSLAQASVAVNSASIMAAEQPPATQINAEPPQALPVVAASAASAVASSSVAALIATPESQVVKQRVVPLVQANAIAPSVAEKSISASSVAAVKNAKNIELPAEKIIAKKTDATALEKTKNTSDVAGFSEQEKTLLSWSESEFTLQLVGLSSEKAARDFMAQQPNKKDLLLFKSLRQGKDWFVVVTGRYVSAAKARQAVSVLPEVQRKTTPWPRDIKTIQREIKQR